MAKKTALEKFATPPKPAPAPLKYPKPRILLVDTPPEAEEQLTKAGFNVTSGTFGRPYRVKKSDGLQPVITGADLPDYTEQEVVVIDLSFDEADDEPQGEKRFPMGTRDLWASCRSGQIDPRCRVAAALRNDFDRILNHGGAFVVFADDPHEREMIWGHVPYGSEVKIEEEVSVNNWEFLTALNELATTPDFGREMACVGDYGELTKLLNAHISSGRFNCTLAPFDIHDEDWAVLATSKYGAGVAAIREIRAPGSTEGIVLVVPQLTDKSIFIVKFVTSILPVLCPGLFPHIEQGAWLKEELYELPRVLELRIRQTEVVRQAEDEFKRLAAEINSEVQKNGWIKDLLTGTDAALVEAVKKGLTAVGFIDVRDVDEERDSAGKDRREDLQIHDSSPVLIVDVKGLSAFPADSDAFQSQKHATLRVQEWRKFEVQGLTIINHQRHLPPLERDNVMPFRQEILDYASEMKFGLITGWDFYRLVRSAIKLSWPKEAAKAALARIGRISPIPDHYELVGTVAHVYTGVVSIQLDSGELRIGDRISFELDVEFEEQEIASLQIEKKAVGHAPQGSKVGTKTSLGRPILRDGLRVYRIKRS